jgi:predicted metal-dependent hydrolase
MPDIDFDKLLKLAASPEVGANAESLSGMLKEAEGVIKLVEKVVNVADRAGALPGLVRAVGKKYGVDVETPLRTRQDDSKSITPSSEYHAQVLAELNKIPEKELKKQFEEAAKVMKEHAKTKPDSGSLRNKESDAT